MIQLTPFFRNDISVKKVENKPYTSSPFRLKSRPIKDEVCFKSSFKITEFSRIPCAYSGIIMVSSKEQKEFGFLIAALKGKDLAKELSSAFKNRKSTREKSLARFIGEKAEICNDKNIQEILQEEAPEAEKRLESIQLKILKEAGKEVKRSLKNKTGDTILENLKKAREAILKKDENNIFKNKKIILSVIDMQKELPDEKNQQALKKIVDILIKLPNSSNSKDAFIVKYHRRSSREIGEKLIEPYTATKEHIIPKNNKGGFLAVMALENWRRKNEPFHQFVQRKPKIKKYITEQFKVIEKKIKSGEIPNHNDYLSETSHKMYKASKHLIDLPYEKIEIPQKIVQKTKLASAESNVKRKKLPAKENVLISKKYKKIMDSQEPQKAQTSTVDHKRQDEQRMLRQKNYRLIKHIQTLVENPLLKKRLPEKEQLAIIEDLTKIKKATSQNRNLDSEEISTLFIKPSPVEELKNSAILRKMAKHLSDINKEEEKKAFKLVKESSTKPKQTRLGKLFKRAELLIQNKLSGDKQTLASEDLNKIKEAATKYRVINSDNLSSEFVQSQQGENPSNSKILRIIIKQLAELPDINPPKPMIKKQALKSKNTKQTTDPTTENLFKPFDVAIKKIKTKTREAETKKRLIQILKTTRDFLGEDKTAFNKDNFLNSITITSQKERNPRQSKIFAKIINDLKKALSPEDRVSA